MTTQTQHSKVVKLQQFDMFIKNEIDLAEHQRKERLHSLHKQIRFLLHKCTEIEGEIKGLQEAKTPEFLGSGEGNKPAEF